MILGPFLDSAKARSYPFWCVCVLSLSVLCCLLAPLLASSVWLVVLCVLCFGRSPFLLPPMMAGFCWLVLCRLLHLLPGYRFLNAFHRLLNCKDRAWCERPNRRKKKCCLDTEVTALHNSSVVSPWLHWSHLAVTKDSSEVG